MFAIIKNGGRQYKVSVGQKLEVNRLAIEDGAQINISEVLLISDANRSLVGAPYVENAAVIATVEGQKRGEKLIVFKYKSKKRYRHRRGHRQELTVLSINDIIADGKSLITGEAPRTEVVTPLDVEETPEVVTEDVASEPARKAPRRRRTTSTSETESSTEE